MACALFVSGTPTVSAKLIIGKGEVTAATPLTGRILGEVERGAVIAFKIEGPGQPIQPLVSSSRQPGIAAPAGKVESANGNHNVSRPPLRPSDTARGGGNPLGNTSLQPARPLGAPQ